MNCENGTHHVVFAPFSGVPSDIVALGKASEYLEAARAYYVAFAVACGRGSECAGKCVGSAGVDGGSRCCGFGEGSHGLVDGAGTVVRGFGSEFSANYSISGGQAECGRFDPNRFVEGSSFGPIDATVTEDVAVSCGHGDDVLAEHRVEPGVDRCVKGDTDGDSAQVVQSSVDESFVPGDVGSVRGPNWVRNKRNRDQQKARKQRVHDMSKGWRSKSVEEKKKNRTCR